MKLVTVVYASELPLCADCEEEPYCPKHKKHFADCPCVGPSQDDLYEYSADGLTAWKKPKQRTF